MKRPSRFAAGPTPQDGGALEKPRHPSFSVFHSNNGT